MEVATNINQIAILGDHLPRQCGIATRNVAHAGGLGFVPIVAERFDLVMRQRDYFRPPLQALMAFLSTAAFAARSVELTGYDIAEAGRVRYAP